MAQAVQAVQATMDNANASSNSTPSSETPVADLTMEQKNEIASFASINPDLPVDMIRENYAEKFKKIITPDMLTKIMKRGNSLGANKVTKKDSADLNRFYELESISSICNLF